MARPKTEKPTGNGAIAKAEATGDRLEMLRAMRKLVAARLDTCGSDRDLGTLTHRLSEISLEIETIENKREPKDSIKNLEWRLKMARIAESMKPKPLNIPKDDEEDTQDEEDDDDAPGYWKKNPQKGAS